MATSLTTNRFNHTHSKRQPIVLEPIKPDCDWKQWHKDNFTKIKSNKFEAKEWTQPSCDHRTYKYLQLNNGLKVLLIYDNKQERRSFEQKNQSESEEESKSNNDNSSNSPSNETDGNNYYNVSLCVSRGYYSDIASCPGLAHYCEHMLFMGNKKYPSENSWEDWLSLQGGSANASTHNLYTNYVFDIAPKGKQLLFEALDRFAHNFISPLFNCDSSERELNAIENEFNFYKTDDGYKQWLVLKENVLKSNDIPYYKFGSGNIKTLNNENINNELIKYWCNNYHPNNMSLIILSDVNLNELETYVIELFEQIKIPENYIETNDEKKEIQSEISDENPLRMEPNLLDPIYGKCFRVNAVKENYTLDIYWILNGNEQNIYYDSSPTCFISELLGHEGIGSLHEMLNDKNWINSLECGYETEPEGLNHKFEFFEINFDLTKGGYDNVYEIIDLVFKYLAMLKRELWKCINSNMNMSKKEKDVVSMEEYYIESKLLGEIAFNFSNNTNGWEYVDSLSIKLHNYPICHLLSCDYLYWKYNPLLIYNSLKELTPDRCCIMLLSIDAIDYIYNKKDNNIPKVKDRIKCIEPILNTEYTMENIPKMYVEKWMKYMEDNGKQCDDLFHLPMRNEFIPIDLNLLSDVMFEKHELWKHFLEIEKKEKCGAELLVYNQCMKLYYKLDRTYYLPKSYITIVFEHNKIWSEDGINMVSLYVLVDMFEQYFAKYSYQPTLGGLNFEFHRIWRGLKLQLNGYSQKIYPYFKQLLNEIKTFKLDEELFKTQKNALIRSLKNEIIDCEDHLPYIARKCIIYKTLTIEKELIAANNLNINHIENVRNLLFKNHENNIRVYGLFTGNMQPQIVNDCHKYLMNICNINHCDENIAMYDKYVKLLNENKFLSQCDQRNMRFLFSKCDSQCIDLTNSNNILYYKEICISEEEDNEGVLVIFQMDNKPIDENNNTGMGIICALIRSLLSEPFYDSLRTKQQLGYDISVTYETVCNIPFIKFQIISSQYNPHYLTLEILKFINDTFYKQYICDVFEKDKNKIFKDKIDSAIRSRKIECSTLSSRHNMYWNEIFTYNTYEFNAKLNEVEILKNVKYSKIKQIYENKFLLKNKPKCIINQIWKQNQNDCNNNGEQKENLQNINTLSQLKQHIYTDMDLKSSDIGFEEINDINIWQKSQPLLQSYL